MPQQRYIISPPAVLPFDICLDRIPDKLRSKIRSGRRSVLSILRIHFKIRPAVLVAPPLSSNGCKERSRLLCDLCVSLRHSPLHFRFRLLRPGHIDYWRAASLPDPACQCPDCLKKLFFRAKGMRMLLQDDIVIIPKSNIESNIRLFHVLRQKPSGMRQHRHFAVAALLIKSSFYHTRHVVVIGMAVADKQYSQSLCFHAFHALQYIVLVFFSAIGSAIHFIRRFQRIMKSVQYKLTAINIPCKLLKFPAHRRTSMAT